MSTLVFLLEEPSAQDALEGILPRILPNGVNVQYLVFEGKQDLERRMGKRMRAWLLSDTRFIVLRDQDSGDCRTIKSDLAKLCRDAGKPDTLVRIACRELESWFVGDLAAVSRAFSLLNRLMEANRAALREGATDTAQLIAACLEITKNDLAEIDRIVREAQSDLALLGEQAC